jgi:hypothetical protein
VFSESNASTFSAGILIARQRPAAATTVATEGAFMFFPLWIVIPVAALLVLVVLYVVTVALLMLFAEYFARGVASSSDSIEQPIRGEQLASFERVLEPSTYAPYAATRSHGAALTRRTG